MKWKSPKTKPVEEGQWYLATIKDGTDLEAIPVIWDGEDWYCFDSFNEYVKLSKNILVAWAEMPAPFSSEPKEQQ